MDIDKVILRQLMTAVLEWGKYRSGIFMSDNGGNLFSGVFLSLDNRFYAITADHCIKDIHDKSTLFVSTNGTLSLGVQLDPRRAIPLPEHDVAAIALDKEQVAALHVTWITRGEVTSKHAISGALVCLPGFPGQIQRGGIERGAPAILHPHGFCYFSEIAGRDRAISQNEINPETDILIEYDKSNAYAITDDSKLPEIEPHGMSGCGVFVIPRPVDGELWNPGDIKLAGIQSSYSRRYKLLVAIKLENIFEALERVSK